MAKDMMRRMLGANRTSISLGELAELKKIFKVSIASLAVRCRQLSIVSKATYGRLFDQIKSQGWNGPQSGEPCRLDPAVPQRMERLCLPAVAEGAISLAKAAELLQLGVRDVDARLAGAM